ncbi:MAG: flagellar hook-length control protein FliK [Phycisphaerales bacterium JB047]
MSNASSTIQSDILSTRTSKATIPNTQGLRQIDASLAPDFAQVLQAFDSSDQEQALVDDTDPVRDPAVSEDAGDEAEATAEDADESAEAGEASAQDGHASGSEGDDADQSIDASDTDSKLDKANDGAQGAEVTTATTDDSGANYTASAQAGDQVEIKEAAHLDLLVNRGDMAKLSMRGLVQSMRAQSSPDLTTIAVQTRLGQAPQAESNTTAQDIPAIPKLEGNMPEATPPTQDRSGNALNDSSRSLSDGVPESPRTGGETAMHAPGATKNTSTPTEEPILKDQARTDVQQTRSARADASTVVQSNAKVDLERIASLQATGVGPQAKRVEGALTSRAISGVDAGGDASNLKGTQPNAQRLAGSTNDSGDQRASILSQVQRGLAQMMRSGKGDMTIKLTPGHLGELRVQMKQDGDRVSLRLTASNDQARELLTNGSKELVHTLQSKGITVERVQIDVQVPDSNDASSGASDFSDSTSADHGQSDQSGAQTPNGETDEVVPIEFDAVNPNQAEPETIWTELGLDAIA